MAIATSGRGTDPRSLASGQMLLLFVLPCLISTGGAAVSAIVFLLVGFPVIQNGCMNDRNERVRGQDSVLHGFADILAHPGKNFGKTDDADRCSAFVKYQQMSERARQHPLDGIFHTRIR